MVPGGFGSGMAWTLEMNAIRFTPALRHATITLAVPSTLTR